MRRGFLLPAEPTNAAPLAKERGMQPNGCLLEGVAKGEHVFGREHVKPLVIVEP
jgi:hypothetical protein